MIPPLMNEDDMTRSRPRRIQGRCAVDQKHVVVRTAMVLDGELSPSLCLFHLSRALPRAYLKVAVREERAPPPALSHPSKTYHAFRLCHHSRRRVRRPLCSGQHPCFQRQHLQRRRWQQRPLRWLVPRVRRPSLLPGRFWVGQPLRDHVHRPWMPQQP